MIRILRLDRCLDLFWLEDTTVTRDPMKLGPGQRGCRSMLVQDNVSAALYNDFITRLGLSANRELVGHDAGRHIQRSGFSQKGCRDLLQAVDSGIFAVDIVAHGGAAHGFAHHVRGLGDGVASEVDHRGLPVACSTSCRVSNL